eukprot:3435633-Rhodomonas_salina.2
MPCHVLGAFNARSRVRGWRQTPRPPAWGGKEYYYEYYNGCCAWYKCTGAFTWCKCTGVHTGAFAHTIHELKRRICYLLGTYRVRAKSAGPDTPDSEPYGIGGSTK